MHLRAVNLEIKMLSHKEIKLNIYFYCNKLTECNYIKFLWLSKSWLDMEALVFVLSFTHFSYKSNQSPLRSINF